MRSTSLVQHLEALPWQLSVTDNDHLREYAVIITEEVSQLHVQ